MIYRNYVNLMCIAQYIFYTHTHFTNRHTHATTIQIKIYKQKAPLFDIPIKGNHYFSSITIEVP